MPIFDRTTIAAVVRGVLLVSTAVSLAACGGEDADSPPPAPSAPAPAAPQSLSAGDWPMPTAFFPNFMPATPSAQTRAAKAAPAKKTAASKAAAKKAPRRR